MIRTNTIDRVETMLYGGSGALSSTRDGLPDAASALERLLQRPVPIAYLSSIFPARSETFVYREVRALRNRGWDVHAVSLHDSGDDASEGLNDLRRGRLVVYESGLWRTLRGSIEEFVEHPVSTAKTTWFALRDAIAPGEPTPFPARMKLLAGAVAGIGLAGRLRMIGTRHLHCHFSHSPTTVGMYAAIQLDVPFSFTGHANDLFQRRALLKRKLQRAAFVACISCWHRDFYRQVSYADDTVYPIIRCGVDLEVWNTAGEPALPEHGPLRVLTVCRLVEKKGVDSLLRALARFGPADQGWHLTIAGEGPQREALQALAKELAVSDRVEFLGSVSNERVRELLPEADLFALPCRADSTGDRDGIPVVLMEAMACGVPVISGDQPAIRELIENGVSGLLVDADAPGAVADAIRRIAAEPGLRGKLARAGRSAVETEFGLEANINRLERVVERTINHRPKTPATAQAAATPSRKYALITPCRDEAQFARRTLEAVTNQTIPPALWVIVDDGSKDETPQILAEYAAKFPYIKVIRRADRGERKLGGGVIDAFYSGYETINPDEFDYICKFDLDLDLPRKYFEKLMSAMEQNPRIGTASGKPYFLKDGRPVSEMCGDENSVGMIKFYRTACFEQIGGFVREVMWDGIDCHRCRMHGWIAVSWDDPDLNFEHLRPMGTSDKSWWTGRVRHGMGQYFMGTGFPYMLTSAVFRMTRPPVLAGGIGMLWGYLTSMYKRIPRYDDPTFRTFLRNYQQQCLLNGKSTATRNLNRTQAKVWNAKPAVEVASAAQV